MEKFSVETFNLADFNGCTRSMPSIPFTTPYILDCSYSPNTSPLPINSYNVTRVSCGRANTGPFGRTGKPWRGQNLGHISNSLTNNPNGLMSRNYSTNITMRRGSLQRNMPKRLLNPVQCDDGFVFIKPPPECSPQAAKMNKVKVGHPQNSKLFKFPLTQKTTSFHPSCSRKFSNYGGSTGKSKLNYSPMKKGVINVTHNSLSSGRASSKDLNSETTNQTSSHYIKSNKRSGSVYVKSSDMTNYNNMLTNMKLCKSSLTQITPVNSSTNSSGIHGSVTTPSSSIWEQSSANDDNIDTQVCIYLNKKSRYDDSKSFEAENQRCRGSLSALQYCNERTFRSTCNDRSFTQHQQQYAEQILTNDNDDQNIRFNINKNNYATANCCNYQKKDVNRPHAMYEFDSSASDLDDCSGYQLPKCSRRLQSQDDYNSRSRSKSRKKRCTSSENQRTDKKLEKNANKVSEGLKKYENLNSFNPQKFRDNMGKYKKFNHEQISNSSNSRQILRNSGGCDIRNICKDFRNTKIYLPGDQNNYRNCGNFVDSNNVLILRNNPYKNSEDSVTQNKYKVPKNKGPYKYSKNQNQAEAEFIYGETLRDADDAGQHVNDTKYRYRGSYKNESSDEVSSTENGSNMRYRRRLSSNSRHRYAQSSVNQNRNTGKYVNECERFVTCDHCCSRCRDNSNCRYNWNNFSYENDKSKRNNGCENAANGYDNSKYISNKETICHSLNSRYRSINANNYNQVPLSYVSDNDKVRDCDCDCDNFRHYKGIRNIIHDNDDLKSHKKFGSFNSSDYHKYLQTMANNFQATGISNKYCRDKSPSKNQKLNHNTASSRKCLESDDRNEFKKTAEHNLEYFEDFDSHIYDSQTEVFSIHMHPRNQKELEATDGRILSNAVTEQAHHESKNVCKQININEFKSSGHQGLKHCLNWSPPNNLYNSNNTDSRLREQHEQEQASDDNEINSIIQINIDMLPSTSKGIPFQTWLNNASGCCKDKIKSQTKFYCANGLKFFEKTTCKEAGNSNDILPEQPSVSAPHKEKNEKSKTQLVSEDDGTSRLCLSLEVENSPSKSECSNASLSNCYDAMVSKEIPKGPYINELAIQMQQSNEKSSEIGGKMEYKESNCSLRKEKQIFKVGANNEIIIDEHVKMGKSCDVTKRDESDNNWVDIPRESEQNIYAKYSKLLADKIAKEKQHKLHRSPWSILRAMLGPSIKPRITNYVTVLERSSAIAKKALKGCTPNAKSRKRKLKNLY